MSNGIRWGCNNGCDPCYAGRYADVTGWHLVRPVVTADTKTKLAKRHVKPVSGEKNLVVVRIMNLTRVTATLPKWLLLKLWLGRL